MAEQTKTRKARTPIDPNETDRQRFVRLGSSRTSTAIEAIRKVALLGNKASYEYQPEDVVKIEKALRDAVDGAVNALKTGKPTGSGFSI